MSSIRVWTNQVPCVQFETGGRSPLSVTVCYEEFLFLDRGSVMKIEIFSDAWVKFSAALVV